MRERPLLWFACVFLAGLAFGRNRNLLLLFVLFVFVVVEIYYGASCKFVLKSAGRSAILLSAFLLGVLHMETEESFRAKYMVELESRPEEKTEVLVLGEIIEVKNTDYGVRIRLTDCYIYLKEKTVPCNDVLVYASSSHFHVGEIHKIKGKLNLFENARNQGGFDSKKFYQSQKIDFALNLEETEFLAENNKWKSHLFSWKEHIKQVYFACMDKRAAGFFIGLLLGDKSDLESEIKDLFTVAGISHILAISGLHISLIGRNIYQLLRRIGMRFAGAGIIAGIILLIYGVLVGNGMSTVRAIGMMLIYFFGQYLGRSYDMLNALGALVIFLLWENPFLMEYSGFWFSVMALIGVGFVGNRFPGSFGMSIGITFTSLPVVAYNYYEIPLYSPLVNFIVLPILTPIFILALCGGLLGMFIPAVAKIILMPCGWGLKFYIWLCEFIEKLPFSSMICGKPNLWNIFLYYLVLAFGVMGLQKLEHKNAVVNQKWVLGIVTTLCFVFILYPKGTPFEITFMDVGQGDAIYISTGDNTTWFIDGGSTSEDNVGEYSILPFLKSKGIKKIDYWFISHADLDHISGVLEVLESGYEVGHFVISKYAPQDENRMKLISTAELCGVPVVYMRAGDRLKSDKATFTCIYPWEVLVQDKNEASLVLKLEVDLGEGAKKRGIAVAGERINMSETVLKALFAGDISSKAEKVLLEHGVVSDVWLYKASHHGSKYSNSAELLEVIQPEITVVSCSLHNLYGHPHTEAIKRMESVESTLFYTMENGQVSVLLLK